MNNKKLLICMLFLGSVLSMNTTAIHDRDAYCATRCAAGCCSYCCGFWGMFIFLSMDPVLLTNQELVKKPGNTTQSQNRSLACVCINQAVFKEFNKQHSKKMN